MKTIGVILSGNGVYDGSEIHEAVFTLLAIAQNGATYECYAPDMDQHHVINHLNGAEMNEKRNVLIEAARIARGEIKSLKEFNADRLDGLVIPGGFGAAKNLTGWAFNGPNGQVNELVQAAIVKIAEQKKPICGLCMGPVVIAKSLEKNEMEIHVTVGTSAEKSAYDIAAIAEGLKVTNAVAESKSVREICIDQKNKIVTAPCYMMEADITQVKNNIDMAIAEMFKLI